MTRRTGQQAGTQEATPARRRGNLQRMKSAWWMVALLALVAGLGCGQKSLRDPASSPNCTCAAGEKFDGDTCVADADFAAPTGCTDDGDAVCGCDSQDYGSQCAAFAVGVQVAFSGACTPPEAPRGLGW